MEEQQTMSRTEAAVYLSTKGLNVKPTTLAKYASEGTGPSFTRGENGRDTQYDKAALDAWLAAGGRKPKSVHKGGRPRKPDELMATLEEFLPMVERVALGRGTFSDGVQFTHVLDRVKRAVRQRRNGAHQ
jgi:hypothetical protein